MKLLFLIDSLGSGGAQRQLTTVATLLKKQGINVEVLCYARNDFFATPLRENNIPIHWITPHNYILRIIKIRKFIRSGHYDAVISFLDIPDFLNCIAAIGGHSWKVITSERSAKEETFLTKKGRIVGWIKRYSDAIVCNSENAKQLWLKYYPQYENKLKVIYNIVTQPKISSVYEPRRDGKTHIVVAASYQYLKNPINVIEAVNMLDEHAKSKLVVNWYGNYCVTNGNTQVYQEATVLVSKYNLQKIVYLNDVTAKIADKMNEADVVGLFSKFEGLPNAICEGMILSKPIIMTKVSDYYKLVDKSNGFLCDWNDINTINKGFRDLIDLSNEELISMGKSSQKKAEQIFAKENIINQWIKILKFNLCNLGN